MGQSLAALEPATLDSLSYPVAVQTSAQRYDKWGLALAPLAILLFVCWFAGWTGEGRASAAAEAAWVLMTASWPALAWMTAAVGLGSPLRMLVLRGAKDQLALQAALGVAAMLVFNASFGALGWLHFGGSIGAWMLTTIGCTLAICQFIKWLAGNPSLNSPPLLTWTCTPAVAVMALASASAPGWLWSTEFGGYDALSYHLQLPREWLALGRIQPLQHNVYSFLPGYVEAAYLHLMLLKGDAIDAVYASQMLHSMLALITAWMIACIGRHISGPLTGVTAAVLMLGTPWVVVTGSLAYNEMATTMMLAAGMLAAMDRDVSPAKRGLLIGALAAAACGAKLTSLGLVALPLGIVLLLTIERRRWLSAATCGVAAGLIVLTPWLIRNVTACGNPFFPFATGVFGTAHWSAEQVAIWYAGHASDGSITERLHALWNQVLRYGLGTNPAQGEPWKPQWLVLPWLALIGLAMGIARSQTRRWAVALALVMAIQMAFWLLFTHLQSRFLLPAVVPMSLAAALAFDSLLSLMGSSATRRGLFALTALGLVSWSFAPAWVFRSEARGEPAAAIGLARTFTGDDLQATDRRELGTTTMPAVYVNWVLPEGGKVLFIGESAPLYYQLDRITYNTVWDRGPLSKITRSHPDDPGAWIRALRESGYTHILINPSMLQRWERSGWNDPLVSAESVMTFALQRLRPIQHYPRGEVLFEIPPNP